MSSDALLALGAEQGNQSGAENPAADGGQQQQSADAGNPRVVEFIDRDGNAEKLEVPDEFWDAEKGAPRLGALLKSRNDLRAKLGEGKAAAPETYELRVPEALAGRFQADPEQPIAKAAMAFAKKHGLSQEAFDELAATYFEGQAGNALDPAAEMAALEKAFGGKDAAKAEMDGISQWASGLLGQDFAKNPGILAAAEALASSAEGVLLLKAFKDRIGEKGVPAARTSSEPVLSEESLRALQASDAYLAGDPATRRRVAEGWDMLERQGKLPGRVVA
jgi:hypothetical protein